MSNARLFLKNSFALTISSFLVAGMGAVYRVYIVRYLGDVDFGRYTFIMTFSGYFAVIALLGFRQVIIREVASEPGKIRSVVLSALSLRVFTTFVALAALFIASEFIHKGQTVEIGLRIYSLAIICLAVTDVCEAVLIGRQEAGYVAAGSITSTVIKIVVGIYLLQRGMGLIGLLALFVVTAALNAIIVVVATLRHTKSGSELSTDRPKRLARYLLKESVPFLYLNLVSKVYYKNDILLLSFLKDVRAVGWYGAAYLPVDFLLLAGNSICVACYPVMSKGYASSHEQLKFFYRTVSRVLVVVFLPISVALSLAGPQLLALVFGPEFLLAGKALRILAWLPVTETLNMLMGTLLASMYQQRVTALIAVFGTVLAVAINLALIPKYGYIGAAGGVTLASAVNMLIANHAVSKKFISINWRSILIKPGFAALIMVAVILFSFESKLFSLIISIPAYIAALFMLKTFTPEEIEIAKEVLLRRKPRLQQTADTMNDNTITME